jgi:hypothetical protein
MSLDSIRRLVISPASARHFATICPGTSHAGGAIDGYRQPLTAAR